MRFENGRGLIEVGLETMVGAWGFYLDLEPKTSLRWTTQPLTTVEMTDCCLAFFVGILLESFYFFILYV